MGFATPARSCQNIVVHDRLVLHVYFRQHAYSFILLLFNCPGWRRLSMQNAFSLHAVFLKLASIRPHCSHQQRESLLLLTQLNLQAFVFLLHLDYFLWNLIIFFSRLNHTAKNGLLIRDSAAPFISEGNRGRVVCSLPAILNALLTLFGSFQGFFSFSGFLFGFLKFVWVGVIAEIKERNVADVSNTADISNTLLADGQHAMFLADL